MTGRLLLALSISAAAAPAFAAGPAPDPAPAGNETGAKDLAATLSAFVGKSAFDTQFLKVSPDPDGYRLMFDPAKLLPELLPANATVDMSPFEAVVSRREDGNWNAFFGAMPSLSYAFREGKTSQTGTSMQEGGHFKGVFSPEIAAFVSGTGGWAQARSSVTDMLGKAETILGPSTFTLTGAKAANDGADLEVRQTIDSLSERREITMSDAPPGGATPISVRSGKIDTLATLRGVRSKALNEFQAFLVAHPTLTARTPDPAELGKLQDELKARLKAILPLWDTIKISAHADSISGDGGFGTFTARSLTYDASTDGLVKDADAAFSFAINGLDIVSPLVPAWTKTLIPQDFDLRIAIEKVDLGTPLDILINDFDITKGADQMDAIGRKAGEAVSASPPSIVIEPSRIKSAGLELAFNGAVILGQGRPSTSLLLEAKGIDQTIETLKTAGAGSPEANQAIGMLSIAKGFGKSLPDDRLQWVINAEPDGSVKINGVELKGPDAPAADGDDPAPDDGIAPDGEVQPDQAPTDDNALPNAPPQP